MTGSRPKARQIVTFALMGALGVAAVVSGNALKSSQASQDAAASSQYSGCGWCAGASQCESSGYGSGFHAPDWCSGGTQNCCVGITAQVPTPEPQEVRCNTSSITAVHCRNQLPGHTIRLGAGANDTCTCRVTSYSEANTCGCIQNSLFSNGVACSASSQCSSGYCNISGSPSVCTDRPEPIAVVPGTDIPETPAVVAKFPNGTVCTVNSQCVSNLCSQTENGKRCRSITAAPPQQPTTTAPTVVKQPDAPTYTKTPVAEVAISQVVTKVVSSSEEGKFIPARKAIARIQDSGLQFTTPVITGDRDPIANDGGGICQYQRGKVVCLPECGGEGYYLHYLSEFFDRSEAESCYLKLLRYTSEYGQYLTSYRCRNGEMRRLVYGVDLGSGNRVLYNNNVLEDTPRSYNTILQEVDTFMNDSGVKFRHVMGFLCDTAAAQIENSLEGTISSLQAAINRVRNNNE